MNIKYKTIFMPLRGDDPLEVVVYDSQYSGTPVELPGADNPFSTEEDKTEDFFMPVRSQSGYLSIVDNGTVMVDQSPFDWQDLLPNKFLDHPVVLRNANTLEVLWSGFIQHQQPDYVLYEYPVERQYAMTGILGVLSNIFFNTGISERTSSYINFAKVIKIIIDSLPEEVRPADYYFQDYAHAADKLLCKVNPQLFYDVDASIGENLSQATPLYMCSDVLENIAYFFGWSFRTHHNSLYATQDYTPDSNGHKDYLKLTYAQLTSMSTGISAGTRYGAPSAVAIEGSELASVDNNMHSAAIYKSVAVTSDAASHTEIIKVFPEQVREPLMRSLFSDYRGLFIYTASTVGEYKAAGHQYNFIGTSNYRGKIFGFLDEDKFGIGNSYNYDYEAGFGLGLNQGIAGHAVFTQLWPYNYRDCILSLKANFYDVNGQKIRQTEDDTDKWGQVGRNLLQMKFVFLSTDGTTYCFDGARWRTDVNHPLWARAAGGNDYIYVVSPYWRDGAYWPNKYISFESLPIAIGRLEITIYHFRNIQEAFMTEFAVIAERKPLPTAEPKDSNEYKSGISITVKETYDEWSVDTIFASDNQNQFGLGTVLKADNEPLSVMPMADGNSYHPEQWMVNMVKSYASRKRMVASFDLRDEIANVASLTPASRITFKSMTFQPVAICHNWRDSKVEIVAMQVNTSGFTTYLVTPVAGTGITSVSGGGTVFAGDSSVVDCIVAAGYVFGHWEDQDGNIMSYNRYFTIQSVTRNMTLTAVAELDTRTFTITIPTNVTGIESVSGAGEYTVGSVVTISCAVLNNYQFEFWTDGGPNGYIVSRSRMFNLTVTENITLFPVTSYIGPDDICRVYFGIQEPEWGSILEENQGNVYNDGDEAEMLTNEVSSLTAVANDGYEFEKWLLDFEPYSNSRSITFTPESTDDTFLTAVFRKKVIVTEWKLTLRATTADTRVTMRINNDSTTDRIFDFASPEVTHEVTVQAGDIVKLTASYNGFNPVTFEGWNDSEGNHYSTLSISFEMNSDKDLECVYS